jgi:hypothetical protein
MHAVVSGFERVLIPELLNLTAFFHPVDYL